MVKSRGRDKADDAREREREAPERERDDDAPPHRHPCEGRPYDDPAAHLEIERRRFAGGFLPTVEHYALAREQWYELPGVVFRPPMDPSIEAPAAGASASGALAIPTLAIRAAEADAPSGSGEAEQDVHDGEED